MMLERVTSRALASCPPLLRVAVVVIALAGCTEQKAPEPLPLRIGVTEAVTVDHAEEYKLTGALTARTEVSLSFRTAGKVIERLADVGTRVEPGMVLARLDATQQQANVEASVAAVTAADATLRQAAANLERQTSLLAQGFSTRRDYDQAVQGQQGAQAAVDGARAQLALARDQLDQTVLKAPSTGVITVCDFEVGQIVAAAQPLFTLAEDGPRDVVVDVQEGLVGHIQKSTVKVHLVSDPSVQGEGSIREVSPVTQAITGTVRVKIGLDSASDKMLLGSAVSATLRSETKSLIAVPPTALFSDAGKPAVWLLDQATNRVSLRPIEIEAFETASILVKAGLKAGDIVVTAGGNMLHPNQEVSVVAGAKS